MAYFIQAILYILCFMSKQRVRFFMLIIIAIISLKLIANQSPKFDNAIFGRFEYNESTGRLKGDNRSDLAEKTAKVFYSSPLVGIGANNLAEIRNCFELI